MSQMRDKMEARRSAMAGGAEDPGMARTSMASAASEDDAPAAKPKLSAVSDNTPECPQSRSTERFSRSDVVCCRMQIAGLDKRMKAADDDDDDDSLSSASDWEESD